MTLVDQNRLKGNHAEAIVTSWLSRACLVRPVASGTDIGIDLYCESVLDGQPFLHFWAQVKAIPLADLSLKNGVPVASHRFERKHLIYWDRQPIPVYAFLVPFGVWPPENLDRIFGVRLTDHLFKSGVPDAGTIKIETSDCFEVAALDETLNQFVSNIVPFDTSLLLLKRGMVAPLPSAEPKHDWERKFPHLIGAQYLPQLLTSMRDASVMGLSLGLLNERFHPGMEQTRRRFQAVADLFEDEMHAYGLSMLVRAAHTDGEIERAKTYVMRAMARIAADERLELSTREERVNYIKTLLDDFPAS